MRIITKYLLTIVSISLLLTSFMSPIRLAAQRDPVLSQIDLPHDYYFREMYLPQLTSGPTSPTWSPDGTQLIYSMGGSLWQQEVTSTRAKQLSDGPGYDYQPDWSPDGKSVIFVRYDGKSIELMLFDLVTNKTVSLSSNKAVNVEPRWSPDGQSISYVSTYQSGHFLLYTARIKDQQLEDISRLTQDHKSEIKRYYYSAWDNVINPSWSPDGKNIYAVSNREVAHGSGNIVAMSVEDPAKQETIHREETEWRTHPEISPDGSRMIYSSYLGRNWLQLWMLPSEGGYPVQLTYGEYDNTAPRWSPDGRKIAFISNRYGNTSLWILDVFTGKQQPVTAGDLQYINAKKKITIVSRDESGRIIPARLSVLDANGKFYGPRDAWVHGDDGIYPNVQKFESHYFHSTGIAALDAPIGALVIQAQKGPDFEITRVEINDSRDITDTVTITLRRLEIPSDFGKWWSGDLHVHMNYGGNYRNDPDRLREQARAENLDFIYNLIVNKEQRIPDLHYFSSEDKDALKDDILILQGQEFHTSFWGHLGLLNLEEHLILPDYAGYPYTAAGSLFPHNSFIAEETHRQNGLVGYVHPFLDSDVFPTQSKKLFNAVPVDAALGNVDYYELIGFAHHKASEAVWYQLLNCGLRIPAGAGTDAMANYSSLRGPVGLNRVYVPATGILSSEQLINGIRSGKGFVTNSPLLGLKTANANPGDIVYLNDHKTDLQIEFFMRSSIPIEHLELVWNGKVIKTYEFNNDRKTADFKGTLTIDGPGWLLLRAWNEEAHEDVPDCYPYASTNPIYFTASDGKFSSRSAAQYFIEWVSRINEAAIASDSYRNEEEKKAVMKDIASALQFYENCARNATID